MGVDAVTVQCSLGNFVIGYEYIPVTNTASIARVERFLYTFARLKTQPVRAPVTTSPAVSAMPQWTVDFDFKSDSVLYLPSVDC